MALKKCVREMIVSAARTGALPLLNCNYEKCNDLATCIL